MSRIQCFAALVAALGAVAWQPVAAQMHHPAEVDCLAFSDDGKYLITVTRAAVLDDEPMGTRVRVWDVNVGVVVRESEGLQDKYRKATGHRDFYLTIASCQIEPPVLGILHGTKLNFFDWQQQRLAGSKALIKPTWARGSPRLHRRGASGVRGSRL